MINRHLSTFVTWLSQDAGNQQIGFLLGSCGISLALTSEVCLKGLPKTPSGEILQFKGLSCVAIWLTHPLPFCLHFWWLISVEEQCDSVCAYAYVLTGWPRLRWVVTDTKYLTKPSKDWQPHIPTANTDTAYIEVRNSLCICVHLGLNTHLHMWSVLPCSLHFANDVMHVFSTRPVKKAQSWGWPSLKSPCWRTARLSLRRVITVKVSHPIVLHHWHQPKKKPLIKTHTLGTLYL